MDCAWAFNFSINHYPVRFLGCVYGYMCGRLCVHVLLKYCHVLNGNEKFVPTLSPWGASLSIVTIVEESVI